MKRRYFVLATSIVFLLLVTSQCSHVGSSGIITSKTGDAVFHEDTNFAIGEIVGWPDAVGILEGSLANSLGRMYTAKEQAADYFIEGNIHARRYWRTRNYVYYTINLRVVDNQGDIIMTLKNQEPFMERLINEFTMNIVDAIRKEVR